MQLLRQTELNKLGRGAECHIIAEWLNAHMVTVLLVVCSVSKGRHAGTVTLESIWRQASTFLFQHIVLANSAHFWQNIETRIIRTSRCWLGGPSCFIDNCFAVCCRCAKQELKKAVRLHSKSAQAWNMLGLCCTSLGDIGEGVDAYREAIRLDTSLKEAYFNLCQALKEVNQTSLCDPCGWFAGHNEQEMCSQH